MQFLIKATAIPKYPMQKSGPEKIWNQKFDSYSLYETSNDLTRYIFEIIPMAKMFRITRLLRDANPSAWKVIFSAYSRC